MGPSLPPVQWVPEDLSQKVKWPEHEDNHSPPVSARVKSMWNCIVSVLEPHWKRWFGVPAQIRYSNGSY
jgi:hypothetical protein